MLVCRKFYARNHLFWNNFTLFQDLGIWASCHLLVCAQASLMCLWGRKDPFFCFWVKLLTIGNGAVPHGKWSHSCTTVFVSIKMWLTACRNSSHVVRWRVVLLPHHASSGFTWSLGDNAYTKGRNAKLTTGQERSGAVLAWIMLLGFAHILTLSLFNPS